MTTLFELFTAYNQQAKCLYPNTFTNGNQYTDNDGIGRLLDALNDDDFGRTFKYKLTPTKLKIRVRYHDDTTSNDVFEGARMWLDESGLVNDDVRPTRDDARSEAEASNKEWNKDFAYKIECEYAMHDADNYAIITKLHKVLAQQNVPRETVEAFVEFKHEISHSEYFDAAEFIEAWDEKHPQDD